MTRLNPISGRPTPKEMRSFPRHREDIASTLQFPTNGLFLATLVSCPSFVDGAVNAEDSWLIEERNDDVAHQNSQE